MQKRTALILLLVVAGVFASFYAYQKLNEVKVSSLEAIVPEDVIYYVYSYNLDKKIKGFQSSAFFKQLSSSELYNKFIAPKFAELQKKAPILSELIQKDTALAVFSLTGNKPVRTGMLDIGDLLFLARLDPTKHTNIKKVIADSYLSFTDKANVSYKNYKGIKITEYKVPKADLTVSYALVSDVLIFSNSRNIISRSIDLYKNQSRDSLLRNSRFNKLTARVNKDSLVWVYGDLKNYYRSVLEDYAYKSLKNQTAEGRALLDSFMKTKVFVDFMNIMEGYVFYMDYDELRQGLILRSYYVFNRAKDEARMVDIILSGQETDKDTLRLIPRNIIAYYGGAQDLNKSWQLLKKLFSSMEGMMKLEMKSDPRYAMMQDRVSGMSLENMLAQANLFLGINIENDFMSLLGDNFGLIFLNLEDLTIPLNSANPAAGQAQMPALALPKVYGFVQLKDSQAMGKLMQGVMQNVTDKVNQSVKEQQKKFNEQLSKNARQDIQIKPQQEKDLLQIKVDNYKDVNISQLEILNFPLDFLKFNYCILDNYIIVSLFPDLTREIIGVYKDKQGSLGSNYYFDSVKDKLLPNYSDILFFDSKKLIENLKSTRFFSELHKNIEVSAKNNFSKEDLDTILNLLGNISNFSFTNRKLDEETRESVFYIKIEGL